MELYNVAVGPLVVGVQAQEVGTGGGGGRGAFGGPRDRGAVVTRNPQRAFLDGAKLNKDVFCEQLSR